MLLLYVLYCYHFKKEIMIILHSLVMQRYNLNINNPFFFKKSKSSCVKILNLIVKIKIITFFKILKFWILKKKILNAIKVKKKTKTHPNWFVINQISKTLFKTSDVWYATWREYFSEEIVTISKYISKYSRWIPYHVTPVLYSTPWWDLRHYKNQGLGKCHLFAQEN